MERRQTLFFKSTQERERKETKRQVPKSRQANSPKQVGHKEERKGTTKSQTFHQLHEACPLKRGKANPIKHKTSSLEEPSSVVTSLLSAVFPK